RRERGRSRLHFCLAAAERQKLLSPIWSFRSRRMTNFPSHDFFNHAKFAEDPRVVELIGRRLAAGQVLTDRRVGLGARIMQVTSGAAGTVGHAAGLAISAPISIAIRRRAITLATRS